MINYISDQNSYQIDDLVQKMRKYYQIDWFKNQTATWNTHYKPVFAEVLTRRGYGFAFNALPVEKLFTKEYVIFFSKNMECITRFEQNFR